MQKKLSPMMVQYEKIKEQYSGCLLFYRLGDFYELFFEDAELVSKELQLVLTARDSGGGERAPMCGVPYHARDNYVMKLVNKGYKVAICDQLSDPSASKGIVERGVVQIVTPGAVIDSGLLEQDENNYLCSLFLQPHGLGLSFSDISTGIIYISEHKITQNQDAGNSTAELLINEISKFSPVEILFNDELVSIKGMDKFLKERIKCIGELVDNEKYERSYYEPVITESFGGKSLDELKIEDKPLAAAALGVLLEYVSYTQAGKKTGEFVLKFHDGKQYLDMDVNTRRNLELLKPLTGIGKTGCLKWVVDRAQTPMGHRLIDHSIGRPLVIIPEIEARLSAVDELFYATVKRGKIREKLKYVCDIERLSVKIDSGIIRPPELKALEKSLTVLPGIKELLTGFTAVSITGIDSNIYELEEVRSLISNAIRDDAPSVLKDGGVIKEGYNLRVDELSALTLGGGSALAALETQERETSQISKLKIRHNRVFGYYIEVPNSFKDKVPDYYERKQTLLNCERYTTVKLKELEVELYSARDELIELENKIYEEIKQFAKEHLNKIKLTSEAVGMLDMLCSFAAVSAENGYIRPVVATDGETVIKNGRHPVVEKLLDKPFVPNDSLLDNDKHRVNIITGPNMAGKSTYMKQVAMITIMAQMGCFVPASEAKISVVDAVFTRIGASDDMVGGRSTFLVEMRESAYILNNRTERSLIILDEIGRGTSTFDGMSIAKAIIVELALSDVGTKTMFSTHYHELTELECEFERVKNYNAAAVRQGETLAFLNKIVPGGSDDSFGIDVAALAGLPQNVIDLAKKYLQELT
ncbi:MAG: DNA mismatch repair protein MutS [Oscillospiraceae bacterium]|nr:DNA mismatch repair protein MutS [Oscillospiraceae bacterium]